MVGMRRQILLITALITGILSMHAVVAVDSMPGPRIAPMTAVSAMAPGTIDHAGAADEMPGRAVLGLPDPPAPAQPAAISAGGAHDPGHGSGLHQILHLCVSILAALLLVGAATVVVLYRLRRPDSRPARLGAVARPADVRRPPPTSVRLAQLCVLRN